MAFELPRLPYSYDALEPHIDARTMEIHHTKHHAGYTSKLNDAIKGTKLENESIEAILTGLDMSNMAVRNNGGGYYNHKLFWEIMSPEGGGEPAFQDRIGQRPTGRNPDDHRRHERAVEFGEHVGRLIGEQLGLGIDDPTTGLVWRLDLGDARRRATQRHELELPARVRRREQHDQQAHWRTEAAGHA